MAEAYLLACDLLRQNPDAEFALDAAIRTSLVVRQYADTEGIYRLAVTRARLPGKYFVQLAHFYDRTSHADKLKKLISDYETGRSKDPDYTITLARLYAISGDADKTISVTEKAIQDKTAVFPELMMAIRSYRESNQPQKAVALITSTTE